MVGKTQFGFSLSEVLEVFGQISDVELHVEAKVFSWYWMEQYSGLSVTKVIKDSIKLNVLGPKFRTFKPRVPFTVYVSIKITIWFNEARYL